MFLVLLGGRAPADTPQPRVKLGPWATDLKVEPGMNAAGKDLRGSEFVGQDLQNANFEGADLYGVYFWDCNLSGASFRKTHLTEVFFKDCDDIREADFTDAIILRLRTNFHLSPQQLMSTRSYRAKDLRGCTISAFDYNAPGTRPAYDFRGANLAEARLTYGDYRDCDFTGARIDRIELDNCRMSFAQLASTKNYEEGDFRKMTFEVRLGAEADFSGLNLTGSTVGIASDTDFNFRGARINDCRIFGTISKGDLYETKSYRQGDLSGILFYNVDMSGWDLSRQNLTGCQFSSHCAFDGTNLEDAILTSVHLRGNGHLTVDQIKSTWNYKNNRMEGVRLPEEITQGLDTEE